MTGLGLVTVDSNATFDMKMASQLYNSLAAKKLLTSKSSKPSTWAAEFKKLRDHYDEKHIESVMQWYRENMLKKYSPKLYSARKFRERFKDIVAAMKRSTNSNESTPKVDITDLARKVQNRLSLRWPGDEKKDELAFIQLTINYCQSYDRRLCQLKKKMETECNKKDEIDRVLNGGILSTTRGLLLKVIHLYHVHSAPFEMTCWWTQYVNEVAWNWSHWQGDLFQWVLSDYNKKFNQFMSRIIADHFGDGSSYFTIRDLISKEK